MAFDLRASWRPGRVVALERLTVITIIVSGERLAGGVEHLCARVTARRLQVQLDLATFSTAAGG
jgi:hypothetical protein